MSQEKGFSAEKAVHDYLLEQGLTCIEKNYRLKCGEIDLIMQDQQYLVFVEVRARTSKAFGGALASVSPQKRRKIIKTATLYLMKKQLQERHPVRFDVVSVQGSSATITWIKNAFDSDC